MESVAQSLRDVILTGFYTGMRKGEIIERTRDRVNMEEGCFELGIYDTKTGEPRNVYFRGNRILNEIVERRMRVRAIHHDFLFTNRNGNPIEALDTAWFWACKRAGIEDLIFHDLRHAFATYGRRAGIPESVLMKMGGWGDLAMVAC